jgi:hypothetical protein
MCGRYKRKTGKQDIAEYFHVNGSIAELLIVHDEDIRPTTVHPVVNENRNTGERELVAARWGFVPGWHKPGQRFPPTTFNARAEGIDKAGMWKRAFATHPCLVPADSFFEWGARFVRRTTRSLRLPLVRASRLRLPDFGVPRRIPKRTIGSELHNHHDGPEQTDEIHTHADARRPAPKGLRLMAFA